MPIPNNDVQLNEEGYKFDFIGQCRSDNCRARLEFWKTPAGKRLPFDRKKDGTLEPHFASCADADKFRKAKAPAKEKLTKCLRWLVNELRRMSAAGEDRRFEDVIDAADRALRMAESLPEASDSGKG